MSRWTLNEGVWSVQNGLLSYEWHWSILRVLVLDALSSNWYLMNSCWNVVRPSDPETKWKAFDSRPQCFIGFGYYVLRPDESIHASLQSIHALIKYIFPYSIHVLSPSISPCHPNPFTPSARWPVCLMTCLSDDPSAWWPVCLTTHLSDDPSVWWPVCLQYLELRFNRATRLMGTVLFIVQTVSPHRHVSRVPTRTFSVPGFFLAPPTH